MAKKTNKEVEPEVPVENNEPKFDNSPQEADDKVVSTTDSVIDVDSVDSGDVSIAVPEVTPVVQKEVKDKMVKVQVIASFTDLFIIKKRFSGEKGEERIYPEYAVPHLRRGKYVI